jgi:predicted ATP-dependent endonuclease of OLD family
MKIRKLEIKNYRGIKALDWIIPDETFICLIGKGDSGKSSILEAIHYIFYPSWNLSLCDSDFYDGQVNKSIELVAHITDFPEELKAIDKYGLCLRGWNDTEKRINDEPEDSDVQLLSVRLRIDKTLEPQWRVYTDRNLEGNVFRLADRQNLNVDLIGTFTDKHFSWSRGSFLSKISEENCDTDEVLSQIGRIARDAFNQDNEPEKEQLQEDANKVTALAGSLGVRLSDKGLSAALDPELVTPSKGAIALHNESIPLRQWGLGSKRLLLCGIQTKLSKQHHITLVDEFEYGLEPHRIARLLKFLKNDHSGQYFITTHSPVVLCELAIANLFVVQKKENNIYINVIKRDEPESDNSLQGVLRRQAAAFLSSKVVVCEGRTEVGFLRGFDDLKAKESESFACLGVTLLDANGGSCVKGIAKELKNLNYDVCVVADSDSKENFSTEDITELESDGIDCFVWEGGVSIEERAFLDLPWESVLKSLDFVEKESKRTILNEIKSYIAAPLDEHRTQWQNSHDLRVALGKAAKEKSWFKRIDKAEAWFGKIVEAFSDETFKKSNLYKQLDALYAWCKK